MGISPPPAPPRPLDVIGMLLTWENDGSVRSTHLRHIGTLILASQNYRSSTTPYSVLRTTIPSMHDGFRGDRESGRAMWCVTRLQGLAPEVLGSLITPYPCKPFHGF